MSDSNNAPCKVALDDDKHYFWCSCGKSQKQPFCDGSHKGSEKVPLKFAPTKSGEAFLCACKRTKKPPYCDGSHKDI